MRKIISIVLGWWFWATNRNNEMARARLLVCAKCPDRKWFVCGICTCVLQAKSRIKDEECPMNRWEDTKRKNQMRMVDDLRMGYNTNNS